ncbi:MAG TPA: glucose-6-phosphate dehydrogenase, partial [Candidatus Hydrogenedentes bacterium]|nr:glucose-6-phosphate dehydrogenase [Candidatus Hydrogenedentota bacterium]
MSNKTRSADGGGPLAIILIGASGDLALKKVIPALFALYSRQLLPDRFQIIGYARSALSDEAFREHMMAHLTCRYAPGDQCDARIREFLEHCVYIAGQYDSADALRRIQPALASLGPTDAVNRIFYMAIPPFLFMDVARALADAGLVTHKDDPGWSRVVIEKPFGRDRASSDELTRNMARVFAEDQTYRIDHYLGKEVIQNLLVLRFANLIFDPIWNRAHVEHVKISWMEDFGLEGRAGYFDDYGIIRDVMQNHLLQILALVAMEQPVSLEAGYVRDEKVKALRCVQPATLEDLVVGQYTAGSLRSARRPGYREEEGVPPDSITPTYAAVALKIRNRRW